MDILIYNWRDIKNPSAGGAEVFTHEISKRLVRFGHHVSLFTSSYKGSMSKEVLDGITIHRGGNRYNVYFKAKDYYAKNRGSFDIIIDEINTRPFMTPKFVNDGTPIVALIHQLAREFWFHETPFPINFIGYHYLENKWLQNYAKIPTMTVSNSTKQDLIELGFENISLIPEGLNIHPLSKVPEKEINPTLIFVGRMGRAKRPDHAVKAFAIAKEKFPNLQLWMVGDGAMKQSLEREQVEDVTFYGHLRKDVKYNLMSRAHALLVPGVREGWGLVVTEANAMGTPALGYNINGLRDSIINGRTGILSDPNPNALATVVINFMNDIEIQSRLSIEALLFARKFNWDKSTAEFLKVIKKNLDRD